MTELAFCAILQNTEERESGDNVGFRFRKSIKAGPFRVNLSKSGVGYSVGTKGFRYTKKAGGGTRTTASIPGTGISYVQEYDARKKNSDSQRSTSVSGPNNQQSPYHRYLRRPQGITLSTVILAWVLGMFGVHKFQQKKIGMGILYLFTFGLFFVGWFGDAIALTMQYNAQKSDSAIPSWKKGGVYVLVGLCVLLLVSCGKKPPEALPSETSTPTTVVTQPVTEYAEPTTEATVPTMESTVATETATQPSILETTATPIQQTEPTEEMVWIPTGGGTKYHRHSGCSQMNNPEQVPISTAISRGFTPCKRCY